MKAVSQCMENAWVEFTVKLTRAEVCMSKCARMHSGRYSETTYQKSFHTLR